MIGRTISNYKILRKVGEGGMGVVYEAEDTSLKRNVALKFLPIHSLDDEEQQARLVREAQAAAALDHININTVYQIGEADGMTFMAMAFVDGDSLRQKIKRGPLPVGEALSYAIQVASGLRKAHEQGIVHRDIKPGNVLIATDGIVKIVDFGLAKLAGATGLTKTDSTLGTAAYMSPEQAKGQPVDHRCDIWSLGIIFYEMLTGKLPFRGEHEAVVIYSILNEDFPPASSIRAEIPKEIDAILSRALAKDRDDRYATVGEMLSDLRGLHHETPADVTGPIQPVHITKPVKLTPRRPAMMALIAAALVVVFLGALWYAKWMPGTTSGGTAETQANGVWDQNDPYPPPLVIPPEDTMMMAVSDSMMSDSLPADSLADSTWATASTLPTVAVLYFDVLGGDRDQEYFAAGITEDIIGDLSNLRGLRVLSRYDVLPYRGRDFDIRNIGKVLGVDYLLEGSVQREDELLRINTRLVRAQDATLEWNQRFDRKVGDVFAIQSEIASSVADAMKVQFAPDERKRVDRIPTTDIRAYEYYLQGRMFRNKRSKEDNKEAEKQFKRAIDRDEQFAAAMVGLADIYLQRIDWNLDIDPKWANEAKTLLNNARKINPDFAELYETSTTLYRITGQNDQAVEVARRVTELNPNDYNSYYTLGNAYQWGGQFAQAKQAYRRCIDINPDFAETYRQLATIFSYESRPDDAEQNLIKGLQLAPDAPHMQASVGEFYLYRGKFARAANDINQAFKARPETPWIAILKSFILMHEGKLDDALDVLDEVKDMNHPRVYWQQAFVYQKMGKDRDSKRAMEKAMRSDEIFVQIDPRDLVPLYRVLLAKCLRNEVDDPLAELAKLESKSLVSLNPSMRPYLTAAIRAAAGDQAGANDEIRKVIKTRYFSKEYLAVDPMFDAMQINTDFRNMVGLGPLN